MKRLLLAALLAAAGAAQAAPALNPPGLLPTEVARPLLEYDPGVAAARAGLEVALQDAGILERSPYEWNANAVGMKRNLSNGPQYKEWNVTVQKTFRLPGKAAADRNIGKATVEESEARYGEALHSAARELLGLWMDWLAAERGRALAQDNLRWARDSLAAVEKRVRAGDASNLELSLARAELADQQRLDSEARTQAEASWSQLAARFPGMPRQAAALPEPQPLEQGAEFWRERILGEDHGLKVAQAQTRFTQAHAERAKAEKTPDPTLGVYNASETGGSERVIGLTVSMPIPGRIRSLRSERAYAAVEVSRQQEELAERQLEAQVASAVATARGSYDSLQIAKQGAAAMQDNARLMQRSYSLGEADLQSLLLARRQAFSAQTSALQAQLAALKAYYGLLTDSHLIWDLERD